MRIFFNTKLEPYHKFIFVQIQFLLEDFLKGFLQRWEDQVEKKNGLTKEEKRRQLLSQQTRDGWKLTGKFLFSTSGFLKKIHLQFFVINQLHKPFLVYHLF